MTSRHYTPAEWAAKIRLFGKVGEPFIFKNDKEARDVWLLLDRKKFKISKNIIWKTI